MRASKYSAQRTSVIPTGRAWSESGDIDAYGHEHGWRLAHHAVGELRGLADRISGLLDHGWRKVVVVTDHGWLLMPGGLPKADLPEHLTDLRKGRCARLKEGSLTDQQVVSWYWDHHAVRVAMSLQASTATKPARNTSTAALARKSAWSPSSRQPDERPWSVCQLVT